MTLSTVSEEQRIDAVHRLGVMSERHPELKRRVADARLELAAVILAMDAVDERIQAGRRSTPSRSRPPSNKRRTPMPRPWRTSCEASTEPHWLVPATISEPRRGGPVMPDVPEYTPRSVYILEPHADLVTVENGYIPIEAIAERVYGKPYSSLRGCQRDDQHIGNDSVKLYELTSDEDYLQALDDLDNAEIYLGWDSRTGERAFKTGMTELDYWLSIRVADENTPATVEANPPHDAGPRERRVRKPVLRRSRLLAVAAPGPRRLHPSRRSAARRLPVPALVVSKAE